MQAVAAARWDRLCPCPPPCGRRKALPARRWRTSRGWSACRATRHPHLVLAAATPLRVVEDAFVAAVAAAARGQSQALPLRLPDCLGASGRMRCGWRRRRGEIAGFFPNLLLHSFVRRQNNHFSSLKSLWQRLAQEHGEDSEPCAEGAESRPLPGPCGPELAFIYESFRKLPGKPEGVWCSIPAPFWLATLEFPESESWFGAKSEAKPRGNRQTTRVFSRYTRDFPGVPAKYPGILCRFG